MSVYSLTSAAEAVIKNIALHGGSSSVLLRRPAETIQATVSAEKAGEVMEAIIIIGTTTNSLTLPVDDRANPQHLADYIEAIANGTAETAAEAPIGAPPKKPRLQTVDHNALMVACQNGGSAELQMGARLIVHRRDLSARTAIAEHNGSTYLCAGSVHDVVASLKEHLEQQLAA